MKFTDSIGKVSIQNEEEEEEEKKKKKKKSRHKNIPLTIISTFFHISHNCFIISNDAIK